MFARLWMKQSFMILHPKKIERKKTRNGPVDVFQPFNICFHVFRTLARRWKRRLRTKNLRAADWILTASRVRSLGEFTSSVKLQPFWYHFKLREKHRGMMRKDEEGCWRPNGWLKHLCLPSHDVWSCISLKAKVFSHVESLFLLISNQSVLD